MRIPASWLPQFVQSWFIKRKLKEVQSMVPMIRNNRHLRELLMRAKPEFRKSLYDQWKPHLKFKPKPFFMVIK